MSKISGTLKIELISDLCTSDGGAYNSLIDTDVCYDEYGFPYIPARRIKGCLREIVHEFYPEIEGKIFGKKGNQSGTIFFSNAYLHGYEKHKEEVLRLQGNEIVHPQAVLNLYTYIRTQTAIDRKTGVADENSLRTTRVVKRNTVFEAKINGDLTDEELVKLQNSSLGFRHMGMNRTRGMGEIRTTFTWLKDKAHANTHANKKQKLETDKLYRLNYLIELKSALLLKSHAGGQEKTQDFIEGNKIMGILAGQMSNEEFCELIAQDKCMHFSNAYIANEGNRAFPMPQSLYKKKDQKKTEKNILEAMEMAALGGTKEQASPLGKGYLIEGTPCLKVPVKTQIGYYHERPEDKSIGRGVNSFYQMESICQNQTFAGYILAKGESMEKIYSILKKEKILHLGYGRQAEFGEIELITEIPVEVKTKEANIKSGEEFIVRLLAPTILYNEEGMYSVESSELKKTLEHEFTQSEMNLSIERQYVSYLELGGYNTTWHKRKPYITAFGQGSTFVCKADKPINTGTYWIGERCIEGYGEVVIHKMPEKMVALRDLAEDSLPENTLPITVQSKFVESLAKVKINARLEEMAILQAKNVMKDNKNVEDSLKTISRLLIIFKENDTLEQFKTEIEKIVAEDKRNLAKRLLDFELKEILTSEKIPEYALVSPKGKDEVVKNFYSVYLKALLVQAKRESVADRNQKQSSKEETKN